MPASRGTSPAPVHARGAVHSLPLSRRGLIVYADMTPDPALSALVDRWRDATPSERSNAQLYLTELCEALGVEKPRPSGTGYEFEYSVRVVHRDGTEAVNRVDLFKGVCFLLEAKDEANGDESSHFFHDQFKGARRAEVRKHLVTLKVLGVVAEDGDGRFQVQEPGTGAAGVVSD